jgi:hypothetical protein
MFFLIHVLIGKLDLQKQARRVEALQGAGPLVLPRLSKIRTIARTIQSHFTLLAAALRANATMDSGAKAFFLADFTDSTTQSAALLSALWHCARGFHHRGIDADRAIADCRFRSGISNQVAGYHAGRRPRLIPVITATESPVKMPSPASLNYKTLIK